ncbi:hypothetical protein BMG03_08055 [Thioclava nitratireducens]|uniref:Flp family type IVb pilin n=1 Tax=Thioclava nitratireducens TaxID=1915078 RepID=A0ABM6IG22_9RHOB|nr:hypothetical protein [Thioclava nitratireducens]AQS47759.1 hypothetical protein BMG03_08055 [Thioclava nitratireducens]
MKLFKLASLRRLKNDEEGVTVVEYGIALAVALGVAATAFTPLSTEIFNTLNAAKNTMPTSTP